MRFGFCFSQNIIQGFGNLQSGRKLKGQCFKRSLGNEIRGGEVRQGPGGGNRPSLGCGRGGRWRPRWRRVRSPQTRIPERWLLVASSGFHSCPSPTARPWSASEMIKTKRILNVWNSLFTTDGICLFSLPSLLTMSPPERALCFSPCFWPSLLGAGSQCPPVHFVFIWGRSGEGDGCLRKGGGSPGGWRRPDLAAEISQKKKEEIAFRERNLPNVYVPTRLC